MRLSVESTVVTDSKVTGKEVRHSIDQNYPSPVSFPVYTSWYFLVNCKNPGKQNTTLVILFVSGRILGGPTGEMGYSTG